MTKDPKSMEVLQYPSSEKTRAQSKWRWYSTSFINSSTDSYKPLKIYHEETSSVEAVQETLPGTLAKIPLEALSSMVVFT